MNSISLAEACDSWLNGGYLAPSFAETVSLALSGVVNRVDLAREFEVAESTVSRWAKGTARPHPRLQRQIVLSLLRRAGDAQW